MPAIIDLQESRVARAFDSVAESFEDSLENEITRRFRQKVYLTIQRILPSGSTILDINCGVGIDAVNLAKLGYFVTGVDLAPKMIEQAKARAQRERANIKFEVASFEDLSSLAGQTFDLVLSNFGGLNCVESLEGTAKEIARVTRPGGYFVSTVMPRVSPWEIISGLARLNTQSAFRRFRNNVTASGFRGITFIVHYHSVRSFLSSFSEWFTRMQMLGMNIISPPPHATTFVTRHAHLTKWLSRMEDVLATLPGFRSVGDHYLLVLSRKIS